MKVVTKDGVDVTGLMLKQMKGEITRDEFIKLAGLDPEVEEKHYQERLQANKNVIYI
jgi:hypothetical protein